MKTLATLALFAGLGLTGLTPAQACRLRLFLRMGRHSGRGRLRPECIAARMAAAANFATAAMPAARLPHRPGGRCRGNGR